MTHDEWLAEKANICYTRGYHYSQAGNAKDAAERKRHIDAGDRFKDAEKLHDRKLVRVGKK